VNYSSDANLLLSLPNCQTGTYGVASVAAVADGVYVPTVAARSSLATLQRPALLGRRVFNGASTPSSRPGRQHDSCWSPPITTHCQSQLHRYRHDTARMVFPALDHRSQPARAMARPPIIRAPRPSLSFRHGYTGPASFTYYDQRRQVRNPAFGHVALTVNPAPIPESTTTSSCRKNRELRRRFRSRPRPCTGHDNDRAACSASLSGVMQPDQRTVTYN